MLLSFIIVAYNAEQKLPALLEDLQAQTCDRQDVELLLVDGRSNDGTRYDVWLHPFFSSRQE